MNQFVSALAPQIQGLLDIKHAMGLPYEESERHLHHFDVMCAQHYPGQVILSREMAMEWVVERPGEHVNGQMRRITPIRQLAKHIALLGAEQPASPAHTALQNALVTQPEALQESPDGRSTTIRISSPTKSCVHSSMPPTRSWPPRMVASDS